ncbi:MAG: hypothetical protein ABIR55_18585, partial [Burkholderiaceae bacterium]
VPLALAVIPLDVQPQVLLQKGHGVWLLQHGCDHTNRAGAGEKKTEFPFAEPVDHALARLQHGWAQLQGPAAVQVLVPPWNRIGSAALPGRLAQAGYRGLSRFGARARDSGLAGLVQVNTHVDIIDWHGTRGFVGEDQVLQAALAHLQARREGRVDPQEATGWLTHHLVHDAACWDFLARLFAFCREQGTVVWQDADRLFSPARQHNLP